MRGSPLSLLPGSPSQSPPVDSRSGLEVCTGSWDGNPPSWAVPPAIDGPEKAVGGTRPGGSWSCVEWDRTAAASFAYIVAGVVAAAGAPAGGDGGGVAAAHAAVRGACSSET